MMRQLGLRGLFFIASVVIFCVNCAVADTTLSFQEGVNHGQGTYNETLDTYVDQNSSNSSYALAATLAAMNGTSSGNPRLQQPLIRFDDIFGTQSNQVPAGATITSATLTLYSAGAIYNGTTRDVEYSLYQMLMSWDASSNYNSFGGNGVQADGVEADLSAAATAPKYIGDSGHVVFDVTASIQAWADASKPNHGWVIHDPDHYDDRWTIASSENAGLGLRPMLEVTFASVPQPSTSALLALGLTVLCAWRKRRQVA